MSDSRQHSVCGSPSMDVMTTQAPPVTAVQIRAIPADVLSQLRVTDDAGSR